MCGNILRYTDGTAFVSRSGSWYNYEKPRRGRGHEGISARRMVGPAVRSLPTLIIKPPPLRRRRSLFHAIGRWFCYILFSPLVLLFAVVSRRKNADPYWVRGFLLLGTLLMIALGGSILLTQSSNQKVFAALSSFDATGEVQLNTKYTNEVNAAASRYGLNPLLIDYVIQLESGGHPLRVSRRGARGLMQIMPQTWRAFNPDSSCTGDHAPGVCKAGEDCIFSAWGNIRIGSLYLSHLIQTYDGDIVAALQAYNAGQSNVVFAPQAKYAETRRYIASFLDFFRERQEKQVTVQLAVSNFVRGLITPLLAAFAVYSFIALIFFWQRQRYTY